MFILFVSLAAAVAAHAADCSHNFGAGHRHADVAAYARSMDRVSLQKAGLAALAKPGCIVDYGCGSGALARDLAVLFPDSDVRGFDLDPKMIAWAREHHRRPNLSFEVGDATRQVMPDDSVDTGFMSATLHHLPNYGADRFSLDYVDQAFAAQHRQLRRGGVFVPRDFVLDEGPAVIDLDLPTDDGVDEGPITALSSARLFEIFARDFRGPEHPTTAVEYRDLGLVAPGWRRFRTSRRDATEFVLHKDYRENWDAELFEAYLLYTRAEMEAAVRRHGFRLLHFTTINNGWIVANRFVAKFRMNGPDGRRLPFPATGFGLAAQKIGPGEGARMVMTGAPVARPDGYLNRAAMRDRRGGEVYDVVSRPNAVVDVLPYFKRHGLIYVLGKHHFPRPILRSDDSGDIAGTGGDGYLAEPITFVREGRDPFFSEVEAQLERRTSVRADQILRAGPGRVRYSYPSPGLVSEVVHAVAIPIRSRPTRFTHPTEAGYSGFATSGQIQPMEATQILRGAQIGSSLDARLEIGTYHLLHDLGRPLGPWIGDEIELPVRAAGFRPRAARDVLRPRHPRRDFEPAGAAEFGKFLEVREGRFAEVDQAGDEIAAQTREFITPVRFGNAVISVLPAVRRADGVWVGLERRQLPAVQMDQGHSDLASAPAWRLPRETRTLADARRFARIRLPQDFGVAAERLYPLGGGYHPSPGLSAEVVYPYVARVGAAAWRDRRLAWVKLSDLLAERDHVHSANLVVSAFRLAHALGEAPARAR